MSTTTRPHIRVPYRVFELDEDTGATVLRETTLHEWVARHPSARQPHPIAEVWREIHNRLREAIDSGWLSAEALKTVREKADHALDHLLHGDAFCLVCTDDERERVEYAIRDHICRHCGGFMEWYDIVRTDSVHKGCLYEYRALADG